MPVSLTPDCRVLSQQQDGSRPPIEDEGSGDGGSGVLEVRALATNRFVMTLLLRFTMCVQSAWAASSDGLCRDKEAETAHNMTTTMHLSHRGSSRIGSSHSHSRGNRLEIALIKATY